jgi:hypothetical protein
MTVKGLDIAWATPSVAEIEKTGAHFVVRYLSNDASKNITKDEVTAYHAAGIASAVVWESTAGRALKGRAAGVADATAAEKQRKAVGLPNDMPVHFAVDTDTSWSSVSAYFGGVSSVIGQKRTGVYGGLKVINGAHGDGYHYLWQTSAWSNGVWSASATMRQTGGKALAGNADVDQAMVTDYGQYPRPSTPAPHKPVVDLSMLVQAARTDPKAPQGHKTYEAGVRLVEAALQKLGYLASTYAYDGSYGSVTIAAYKVFQRHLHFSGAAVNGIPDMTSLTDLGKATGLFTVKG